MPKIHLIEGPVGAGKSTYSAKLAKQKSAIHLDLDDWMAKLFIPDRPSSTNNMEWYLERKFRCIDHIWQLSCDLIENGTDVILELGLIREQDRAYFYNLVDEQQTPLTIHMLEADKEIRRERVKKRNIEKGSTFSMEVSDDFFDMASNFWEPLSDVECAKRQVLFITTEGA